MPNYCVYKKGDHEVHKMTCSNLPAPCNRIEFEAMNDFDGMEKARDYYKDVDGCAQCMSDYHISKDMAV